MRNLAKNNRFVALLLCLTLLVRAVVPVGFMPDVKALQQGHIHIMLCGGHDHMMVMANEDQKPADGSTQDTGHKTEKSSVCPFAAVQASALPVIAVFLATLFLCWRQLRYRPARYFVASTNYSNIWARGPPLSLT